MLRNKALLFFVFLFSLICLSQAQARTYKIGMIHWIAYSPLNVADVKGLWEGVDVQVINFGSNQELNTALENQRIDIAIDMLGSWVGMSMNGVPLTLIGETDWSYGGDKIIAKKDVDMSALKGTTIGVYLNMPSVTFFLNKYLSAGNVNLSDLNIVELEPETMTDNFISGRFKVIVNYDPQALRAEREGGGKIVATSASWDGSIPEGFVAHTEVLKSIPEQDLSNIFKGWIRAVKWSKESNNWAEYKKILNDKTFEGEDPYSDEDLKAMFASVKIHDVSVQLERNKTNGGLYTYLEELHAFLKKNNLLKKDFKPEEIFNNKVIVKTLEAEM